MEVSEYVAEESRGRGIWKRLLQALVDDAQRLGYHALLARIYADNTLSIAMHAAQGFTVVGTLREVGFKFGRMLDVCVVRSCSALGISVATVKTHVVNTYAKTKVRNKAALIRLQQQGTGADKAGA